MLVHEASTIAASLCDSHAVLVAELIGLLHELLHLLHDHLILLLILLLVRHLRLLLGLLIAWRVVWCLLLRLLRCLVPWVGNFTTTDCSSATLLLLSLASGFF